MNGVFLGSGNIPLAVSKRPKYEALQIMIPWTETKKPLYKPTGPSDLTVLEIQSIRPVYCLSAKPFPTSAPKLKKELVMIIIIKETNER